MIDVDTLITKFAFEISRNYKEMAPIDIIRRMKQVQRETAEQCAKIAERQKEKLVHDALFEQERPRKKIVFEIANDIRNHFLS